MGVWRLKNSRVEHCHLCCPFPLLSPAQLDELQQLLYPPSLHIDRSATWRVELTCQHVETLAGHSPRYVEPTVQCTECAVIRGVVKAVPIDDQAKDSDDGRDIESLQPGYQRLTDEQWSWIEHIVHTEDGPRRGRPRADVARSSTRLSTTPALASLDASSRQSSGHDRPPCAGTTN